MVTTTLERSVIQAKDGQLLTIAKGTEANIPYGEMLTFWENVWVNTECMRPEYSVVEEFLIEKRIEVARENQEFDS